MNAMTQPLMPALELNGLAKTFRTRGDGVVRAVERVDLTVQPGEVVALLGPNGAGKTTTLDMVLGLTSPTSGDASVFGRPPREAVMAGRISAVLQSGGLLRDLSVRETVQMVASVFEHPQPIDEVLARAGLTRLAARKVAKCSGGEQQRLRFALALLPDPDLLVLDEPTAGMDVAARREFWATMQADAAAGRTVVFATHYLEEADTFADRIVLMARGHVVADGSTAEIRARASGRTVSSDVPEHEADKFVERLRRRPDVTEVSMRGNRVVVASTDSDAVARALLVELGGRNVEIVTASLESAFLAITDEHDTESAHDQQEALA
ncbi:ABC transporter ATP-binding protein [Aeromicrobium sp.]|uniref:ABC transporter ATP-binding protein n=1 Tax=Aeromicrobium sp. TaxID=1871063 RepID=UPI003D6C42D1